jgi:anti-anti-sigma regulatory factor
VHEYCEQFLGNARQLSLDLGQLSFVDRDGAHVLQTLATRGVSLKNYSPFIAERLKEVAPNVE